MMHFDNAEIMIKLASYQEITRGDKRWTPSLNLPCVLANGNFNAPKY